MKKIFLILLVLGVMVFATGCEFGDKAKEVTGDVGSWCTQTWDEATTYFENVLVENIEVEHIEIEDTSVTEINVKPLNVKTIVIK